MEQRTLIQAVHPGPYSANQPLVDFNIPGDGSYYDLHQSRMIINVNVSTTEQATVNYPTGSTTAVPQASGNGVHNVFITMGNNQRFFPYNTSLVRYAYIESERAGMLEDIAAVNTWQTFLQTLTKSHVQRDSESAWSLFQRGRQGQMWSPFVEQQSIGGAADMAKYKTFQLGIPLAELFGVAQSRSDTPWPSRKVGRTKVHLELDLATVKGYEVDCTMDDTDQNKNMSAFQNYTNSTGAVTNFNHATSYRKYPSTATVPFYPGLRVLVAFKIMSQTPTQKYMVCNITSVVRNADLTITLTWTTPIGTVSQLVNGTEVGYVFVDPVPAASIAFTFERAELQLVRVPAPSVIPRAFQFMSSHSQLATVTGGTDNVQKVFVIPPTSIGGIFLFPSNVPGDNILSTEQVTQYRIRVDDHDVTNRNVTVGHTPLLRSELSRWATQVGVEIRDLSLVQPKVYGASVTDFKSKADYLYDPVSYGYGTDPSNQHARYSYDITCAPFVVTGPPTGRERLVQLTMSSAQPVSAIYLYVFVPREISLM